MNALAPMPYPETSFALTLVLLLLAPLAIAGVALVNAGLGRSRSAAQSMLGSLVVISTAVVAFALVGSGIAAGSERDFCASYCRQTVGLGGIWAAVRGGIHIPGSARATRVSFSIAVGGIRRADPVGFWSRSVAHAGGSLDHLLCSVQPCFRSSRTGCGADGSRSSA